MCNANSLLRKELAIPHLLTHNFPQLLTHNFPQQYQGFLVQICRKVGALPCPIADL